MNSRGHALVVVMALTTVLVIAAALVATQVLSAGTARKQNAPRVQALWLARSALTAGATGTKTIATKIGEAKVTVVTEAKKKIATVELGPGIAKVTEGPEAGEWEERYSLAR